MTTYTYVYDGDKLTELRIDDLNMYIIYDTSGPTTIKYCSGTFYYVTNLQSDAVVITHMDGTSLVEYTYDAWGNITYITG